MFEGFFYNFLHQCLEMSAWFERNCKYTRFVCFDRWLLIYQYIFILVILYIVPWRNKGHYLHASYTYCFILCSILLTPRWNIRLFYTTFVFTIKKVPFWTCPTHPSPPFIATPLRMTLWLWFKKNGNLLLVISGFSELKFPTLILFLLGWLALF